MWARSTPPEIVSRLNASGKVLALPALKQRFADWR
jgi:hypothetical protein